MATAPVATAYTDSNSEKPILHYEILQKKNEKLEADLQALDEKEGQERWKMKEERKAHDAKIHKERRQLEEEILEYKKYLDELQKAVDLVDSGGTNAGQGTGGI